MRLFIATPVTLPFYNLIKNDLSKYIEGKWVEGWNLHITHKFIGEDEPDKYKIDLKIPNEKIKVKGIGLFNNKVLYLKADSLNIKSINEQINNKFNLKKEDFRPHITLCRIKNIKDKKFYDEIKKWENKEYEVPFDVFLYKSILTKKGPIYEKIYQYKSSSS
ncbi:RNA 2',3'-cyclic phosphodiesterase [Caminibacter mediatlanticus TB-2]|uniref:RNA 2',3'-cyclic phosphodiesterase n=1 Tax=Caminibacter mediatlanticus TB-2 TaxID=391592 RepID=A0ABX5V649_9BACT|nr:RNA 2',3'-cyclic phosphodiesterase [Caminibacter mediatlanticus]QCT93752.1 RNA 2',3'-cyclic phosphodiesterase [Caminibacter mediatlanticus TB-2]